MTGVVVVEITSTSIIPKWAKLFHFVARKVVSEKAYIYLVIRLG
jgi:hypothetical protein